MTTRWAVIAWLGAALVVAPTIAGALLLTGVVQAEGGHGLGTWFAASACAVLVLLGAILSVMAAPRAPGWQQRGLLLAWLGGLALAAFIAASGLPFGR
jgi:hypothetical protein